MYEARCSGTFHEEAKNYTKYQMEIERAYQKHYYADAHHEAFFPTDLQPGNAVLQALDGMFLTLHTAQQQAQQQQVAATEN